MMTVGLRLDIQPELTDGHLGGNPGQMRTEFVAEDVKVLGQPGRAGRRFVAPDVGRYLPLTRTRRKPPSPPQIEDHADHLAYLNECLDTHVAAHLFDPAGRHGSQVLALSHRGLRKPVRRVRVDPDLRTELPNPRGQRHDMNNAGPGVENALSRYHNRWMPEASLASRRQP